MLGLVHVGELVRVRGGREGGDGASGGDGAISAWDAGLVQLVVDSQRGGRSRGDHLELLGATATRSGVHAACGGAVGVLVRRYAVRSSLDDRLTTHTRGLSIGCAVHRGVAR